MCAPMMKVVGSWRALIFSKKLELRIFPPQMWNRLILKCDFKFLYKHKKKLYQIHLQSGSSPMAISFQNLVLTPNIIPYRRSKLRLEIVLKIIFKNYTYIVINNWLYIYNSYHSFTYVTYFTHMYIGMVIFLSLFFCR